MLNIIITVIGIIALVSLWIVLYDSNRFIVVRYLVKDTRIRKQYRAVVLADLHDKQYGKDNENLLSSIREQKPDAVLIAGDIITAKPGKKLDRALTFLRQLSAEFPVFYGNGNHEHRIKLYPERYGNMAEEYEKALGEMGIHPMVNEHVTLPELGLAVYGVEINKFYYKRFDKQFMPEEYLPGVLGTPDKSNYTVLLAHNPDYFPEYIKWGADLVLAGHVHGGMVRIPGWKGIVSPAVRLFPKYDGGLYQEKDGSMLLSRGLGMHTIPIRMFNPGELLVVDFQPGKETDVSLELRGKNR